MAAFSAEGLGHLLGNQHGGGEAEGAADAEGDGQAEGEVHHFGADEAQEHRAGHAAGRGEQQGGQDRQHLLRGRGGQIGEDQDGNEEGDQTAGLGLGHDALLQEAQGEEHRAHHQAEDEVVDHPAGELREEVGRHRHQAQPGQVDRP